MFQYVVERWNQIWFASWQHFSLVVQCVVLATVIAVVLATLVYRSPRLTAFANGVSAIGLTLPSFAVIGLLIVPLGPGLGGFIFSGLSRLGGANALFSVVVGVVGVVLLALVLDLLLIGLGRLTISRGIRVQH